MRPLALVVAMAFLTVLPVAGSRAAEITGGLEFSHDSDSADRIGVYAGYRHPMGRSRAGFRTGVLTLEDPSGTERFRVLELSHSSEPLPRSSLDLEIGLLDGDWSPVLFTGIFVHRPGDSWYLEVSGERGIVDSVAAVQREYLVDSWSISADYALTAEFTLVGALLQQRVSDGNDRRGSVARIVYTPRSRQWLNFQVKAKTIDSEFDGTGYFSPERMSEYYLLVGAALPFGGDNWVVRGLAGPGIQDIKDHGGGVDRKPAAVVETRLRGWFTQQFGLEGRLGYTTAQSTGGSDSYVYGELNLTRTW